MHDEHLFDDVLAFSGDEDTAQDGGFNDLAAEDMHICEDSPLIMLMDELEEDESQFTSANGGGDENVEASADDDGGTSSQSQTLHDENSEHGVVHDFEEQKSEPNVHLPVDVSEERIAIMGQLEALVLSVMEQLVEALEEGDRVKTKTKTKRIIVDLADRKRTSSDGSPGTRTLMFPRKGKGASIQPLTQLFRVVSLVHEALSTDMPMTKRDMYYKDVGLFKSQAVVDKLVDDLAATLGVGRADLNVRASAKGLVCGSKLVIHLDGGDAVQANDSEGTLIPAGEDIAQFEVDDSLSWVLIVEKEAVFQTLCRIKFANHPSLPGPGLLITGKGYPDVATRQLVKTLSDNLPSYIPILALVDGDAYGLDILSVYRFGSAQMQHERESLAAARVRWLGIWTSELAGLGIPKDALIPITKHDEKKALSMLRRSDLPKKWRKELQYMLHNRRKAEIEIFSSVQRKATMSGFRGQDPRPPTGDDVLNSIDYADLATVSVHTQPLEPPCLVTYLADKITAIVDSYATKYA